MVCQPLVRSVPVMVVYFCLQHAFTYQEIMPLPPILRLADFSARILVDPKQRSRFKAWSMEPDLETASNSASWAPSSNLWQVRVIVHRCALGRLGAYLLLAIDTLHSQGRCALELHQIRILEFNGRNLPEAEAVLTSTRIDLKREEVF